MMANFKDDQVHMDKCLDFSSKNLSQKMLMRDIKALTLTVEKVISKFSKSGTNFKVKVTA